MNGQLMTSEMTCHIDVIQVPRAMVRPLLSVCNQRHINLLHSMAITQLFTGTHIDDISFSSTGEKEAVLYMYNLLSTLR